MPINARDLPDAIQWTEGMLLAPQHFQQLELRNERLLRHHSSLISQFHWGISRIEYDPAHLMSGTFRVIDLEGIMPDGLLAVLASDGIRDLQIDLSIYKEDAKRQPLTIHLAVLAHRPGNILVNDELARYDSVVGGMVIDENTGDGEIQIPRLRPRWQLLVAEAPPSRYVTFPIAKVSFDNEQFLLTDYIPPMLSVARATDLGRLVFSVARELREKATSLSDRIRTRQYDLGPTVVLDYQSKIQSLVEGLPYLEALFYTGGAHPFDLYLALCAVAGHVATLGEARVPPVFLPYDHNNLRPTFENVVEFIIRMVQEGIRDEWMVIPFLIGDDLFYRQIQDAWLARPLMVGVRGADGVSEREIIGWMSEALIGSESIVQSMRERRILGARRMHREDTDGYTIAKGQLLFEIQPDRNYILPGEVLQIVNLNGRKNIVTEIQLFVRQESVL
ncbi:MAG: type VI secretion system baseplate subunit TssK [Candidatus Kapaibacterium sp.]